MARGIYKDTGAYADDYALHRDHRGRWRVDRVGRGGTHTTIGRAAGEESKTAAAHLAQDDARTRGTYSAAVFLVNPDGSLTQIANIVYGRYQASGRDRSRHARRPLARARRDNGTDSLARDYALAVHSVLRNRYGFSRAEADGAIARWSQLIRTSWAAHRNTGVVAREIKRYEEGEG